MLTSWDRVARNIISCWQREAMGARAPQVSSREQSAALAPVATGLFERVDSAPILKASAWESEGWALARSGAVTHLNMHSLAHCPPS